MCSIWERTEISYCHSVVCYRSTSLESLNIYNNEETNLYSENVFFNLNQVFVYNFTVRLKCLVSFNRRGRKRSKAVQQSTLVIPAFFIAFLLSPRFIVFQGMLGFQASKGQYCNLISRVTT